MFHFGILSDISRIFETHIAGFVTKQDQNLVVQNALERFTPIAGIKNSQIKSTLNQPEKMHSCVMFALKWTKPLVK